MTDPVVANQVAMRRHRRAAWAMFALTGTCVLTALAPAGHSLVSSGWQSFLSRPGGVGATASSPEPDGGQAADPGSGDQTAAAPADEALPAAAPPPPPAAGFDIRPPRPSDRRRRR
jgi:hypothetical protein